MDCHQVLDALPLAGFVAILLLGGLKKWALRAQGVRVSVVDRQRSPAERLTDALLPLLLLAWVAAAAAPVWAQVRLPAGVRAAGALLVVGSVLLYAAALWTFGRSWRVGIDREKPGPLVTHGAFAWSRNPLFLAFDLLLAGAFLLTGRLGLLALGAAVAAVLHAQILREERFLASAFGEAYEAYRARVGRYVGRRTAQR